MTQARQERLWVDRLLRLLGMAPALVVMLFAGWLLWPVPAGVMPLSADHTVHLTRIVLTAQRFASTGSLSGWEPTWFFGFPLGDLYPQLGDLLIIVIHALGLGSLDWPSAYALGFYVVFAIQGLVLVRIGRLFGFGAWPGLIAALLMLADAGFTREGGWMYTVYFGVWPQALATSLAWLGLGELAVALGWRPTRALAEPHSETTPPDTGARATMWAGLWFGTALLAHPIALPTLGIGGLLLIVTLVPRAPVNWRVGLARCALAAMIGALLAAWWWVPMLQNKAWMASYGWLFAPFDSMATWLRDDGHWAQRMPAAVGFMALAGIMLASLGAGRVARFVALFTLVQWLLASSDVFWQLRLDRFSEGFTHIQYQRFLIGAKPGLYLCAGLASIAPAGWARRLYLERASSRIRAGRARALGGTGSQTQIPSKLAIAAALLLAPISAAACLWLLADTRATMTEYDVGVVQTERVPNNPSFDADYQAFLVWARAQWDTRESDYRIAARAPRNSHVFMDAPVWTATPQYKLGFTPGDNFVHKPESGQRELLNKLGVRWLVGHDGRSGQARASAGEVARFGNIYVREHRGQPKPLAWLEGGGELELLHVDLRGGLVRARVRNIEAGARVVFGIAGYPRWQLSLDGQPLEWFEDPVLGDAPPVSPDARRAGQLRGGKARGDDGSEPTLIAAELPAGTTDAILELRYEQRNGVEWIAELISLLTWVALGVTLIKTRRGPSRLLDKLQASLVRVIHPLTIMVLVPALLGLAYARWQLAAQDEAAELLGWVEAGAASSKRVEPGPVKTQMLIRPAVIMRPRPRKPAVIELELERAPQIISGWVGIDDDQAQAGGRWAEHHVRVEIRWTGHSKAQWLVLEEFTVPHTPQMIEFSASTGALSLLPVYLRITDQTEGKRIPRMGINLELGEPPPTEEAEATEATE